MSKKGKRRRERECEFQRRTDGMLIVDDPHGAEVATTPEQQDQIRDWFAGRSSVASHQDAVVGFLNALAQYLDLDGWDRLQHVVCHFDPSDGSWTLSLRVEDGDLKTDHVQFTLPRFEGPVVPRLRYYAQPGQFHHLGRRLSSESFSLTRAEALERMANIYMRMAAEARERGE